MGWEDHRRGFTHYAMGRILQSTDPEAARAQFMQADTYFSRTPNTELHRAYVASQLAAYALTENNPDTAIQLTGASIDLAARHENAALLSTLLMLRAEDGNLFETFSDISGLAVTRPAIAWCLLLLMFSLAGIPPLLGFYSKFVVFQATVEAGLVVFAAIAIAASVIGAFYYIKFVKVMFFDEAVDRATKSASPAQWAILAICTVLISPLGWFLTRGLELATDTAAAGLFASV